METLIAARTTLPTLPDDCIETTAAIRVLSEALKSAGTKSRRLTIVCAPTGYGKSTALAAAAQKTGTEPAYLRVTGRENDGARFWRYLASALSARYDGIGDRSTELLSHAALNGIIAAQPYAAIESFVVSLLNECAEYGSPIVVAVDDFHEIDSAGVIAQFAAFQEETPPNVHIVLLARHEPALDVHRMRARGELLEIGPRELVFSGAQCREFVSRQIGDVPAQTEAPRLFALTEGWPAGLRLALLAPDAVPQLTGSSALTPAHDALSEFLHREVFAHQPAELREFLTATSILPQLSDQICARVVPGATRESTITLESLAGHGVLILREGLNSKWYRYTAPFAEMLRRRLSEERTPRQIAALHRRAARAYADEGLYAEALHHAFEADDSRFAADLLEQRMADVLNNDRNADLTAHVARLPNDLVCERPHLAAAAAMMLVVSGRGNDATELLECIDRGADARSVASGVAEALRGLAAVYAGDVRKSRECAERALACLPFDAPAWRAVATMVTADAEFLGGRIDRARDGYSRALAMCRTHRLQFLLMIVVLRALRSALYLGRLAQLESLIEESLLESRRVGFANTAHEGQIRGFHATLAVLQHRTAVALDRAMRCAESAEGHRSMLVFGMTRIRLAEAYFALGELDRMRMILDDAAERLAAHPLPIVESFLFSWRIRLEVAAAEQAGRYPDRALELIRERGLTPDSPIRVLGERELFAAARAYRLAGRPAEAKKLLERLREFCDETQMLIAAMEARILLSLIHDDAGDRAAALSVLATAVERLVPLGAIGPFLGESAPMKRLLAALLGTPGAPAATSDLISRFDADTGVPPAPGRIEPLSRRELDVLRLVAEGRSNAEIADALFVSLNTVKWHTGNIYSKLAVEGRTAAAARARDLGLLE
ncbi:MAG: hypothetical protein EA426_11450 [Spirochaetaceae bacterium]|nr:MAG: hypothetical protein EA426_11450 [Spirochaetaceae bacterium]